MKGFWATSVSLGPPGKGIDTRKIQASPVSRGNPGLSQVMSGALFSLEKKFSRRLLGVPLFCKVPFLAGTSGGRY